MNPAGYQYFTEKQPVFMAAYRKMARQKWFREKRWTGFIGPWTKGIYMQVYKTHWFNHELNGIHFETALTPEMEKAKAANLQLHITHQNLLPSRDDFNDYTIPRFQKTIDVLGEPYELWEHRASERINVIFKYAPTTFPGKLTEVMGKLESIGDVVDEALAMLWKIRS